MTTMRLAPTGPKDAEYARSVCEEMADDFRFTVEDVDARLLTGATEYARQYRGSFDFMVQMRDAALRRAWLTEGQAKGVLNCMLADVRRERRYVDRNAQPKMMLDFTALRALFAKAGEALQRPRIRLQVDGTEVVIKLMTRGKHPGSLSVEGPWNPDGDTPWYGRIETDGSLTRGRDCNDKMVAFMVELAGDPAAAARRYAHLTGRCCFCGLKLDDARSTAAGYGPICADHYGLPWGE